VAITSCKQKDGPKDINLVDEGERE